MKNKFYTHLTLISLLITGCEFNVQTNAPVTSAPAIITATLPPTSTQPPTNTPPPPPPSPTIAPVPGRTSTQLNVRAEPSTAGEVLGIIPAGSNLQIIGKDPGENWWQILYEAGPEGKGWVTAQFVETSTKPNVPTVGGGNSSNADAENSGVITQQLNVRSGPGTNFNSLGILNANDVVTLTGKNQGGSWLQVEFAEGPDGRGWVNTGFVRANGVDALPIVSELGDVIGTGTPMDTALPPTPTLVPAPMDFDTPEQPLKTVNLGGVGPYTLLYNGDVSSPDGDREDWIAVTTNSNVVWVSVACNGNGQALHITVAGNTVDCNAPLQMVNVISGDRFMVHLQAGMPISTLVYIQYSITLKVNP